MKINVSVFVLFFLAIGYSVFAEQGYPGSQAYNKTKLFNESVNAATGTFDYSYQLISTKGRLSNFQLHLAYRYNKEGMFGLPNGWQLDLDFIKEKSAYIHGQEWLIDRLWRDETGFGSGLRYFNLHGTKFIDKIEAREVPGHKGLFYRYIANHKDGRIKYFSHQGHIVIEKDRFGNFIKFEYEQPVSSLRSARLKRLIDNYGNEYHFEYLPGELILTSPDNKKTHIYFNKYGVVDITNALAQRTEFKYVSFAGRNLLRTIQTPKGLMTQISYGTINYIDNMGKKQLPVVNRMEKIDLASNKKIEETHYTHSQDNNFTGYPLYSLSNNGDNLMDSENKAYRYSVEISRSDLIGSLPQTHRKVFYYNYLHLPIEIVTLKNGSQHIRKTYEYAISPFKYSRSTNYDKPSKAINWVWHNESNTYIPNDKTQANYDLYGNKTEEHRHVYNREMLTWRATHSQTKAYYNDAFGLEKETIRKDEFTGQMIRTTYTLSKDNKTHADKIIEYKAHDETQWKPWQKFTMQHDDLGRKTYSSAQWLAKGQPDPQKTFYTKDYQHDPDSGLLTVKQTSALGSVHTEVQDTHNGNLMKKVTPEDSIWQYEYDDLDRLTKEINPLGKTTLYTYHDFDKHQINQIIKETPLEYKFATVTDAAGRVIAHKDYHQNTWRTLSTQEHNGWNKVIKKTNILGLENITIFDQLERPIKNIDYWGNIKRIEYNDVQLLTTAYLNQHKVLEKESQPWVGKTIQRKYPIFDNAHDPQTHFLEETLEKNGFGQNMKHSSSLVHRHTLNTLDTTQSFYRYDPSFNRIIKTIQGFDGLQFMRLTQYDLFRNVVKHTKEQTKDKLTTQGETDLRQYNVDNQLISLTTPGNITTKFINNKEGRRIKTIQPDGEEILFAYNPLGQIVKNSWMRAGKPIEFTKAYDDDNHLIALSDSNDQTIRYSYLPNGKVHSITYPDGQALTLDYDDKNRVIDRIDFSGKHYQFKYNDADKGLLSELHVDNHRFDFNYGEDDNNIKGSLINRKAIYHPDNVTETDFYYGAFRNAIKTTHHHKPSALIYNTGYHFNGRGQRKSITYHTHKGHQRKMDTLLKYQYDSLNRLIGEKHETNHLTKSIDYNYDANNNLITETYYDGIDRHSIKHEYNNQNQRLNSTGDTQKQKDSIYYSWNKNGHLEKTSDNIRYEYDAQGYLLTINNPHSSSMSYQYLPNGLLSGRSIDNKRHSFYHGINKKITAIKDDKQWYSLLSDYQGIQANIADDSVDQFFISGRNTGAILTKNADFQTTTYTAYGKPVTPLTASEISSSFGWNQEYTDQDTQLTYLQRRFYSPDLKMFISRDSFFVDNNYTFGKANPITFFDPTGHSAAQATNYTIGPSIAILGILGIVLAAPTGGASLTISQGAGIAAGVTSIFSGLSLVGAQTALDTENKKAATALQYTSLVFTIFTMIEVGVSVAPYVSSQFFSTPTTVAASSSLGSLSWTSNLSTIPDASTNTIFDYSEPIGSSLSSSQSEPAIEITTDEAGKTIVNYTASKSQLPSAPLASSEDFGSTGSDVATLAPYGMTNEAYVTSPTSTQPSASFIPESAGQPANTPLISYGRIRPGFIDMTSPQALAEAGAYNDLSTTEFLQSLDFSTLEETYPNELIEIKL